MRFAMGIVIGILLTIGAAYVTDATRTGSGPDGEARRMVHWSVVSANMQDLSNDVYAAWARLVGSAKEIDRKTGI